MIKVKKEVLTKAPILFNVGACLDIPTCELIKGAKGETIINGGLNTFTGVVGFANNFKSTVSNYLSLAVCDTLFPSLETGIHTYDTESTVNPNRLADLTLKHEFLNKEFVLAEEPNWTVVDNSEFRGDEWLEFIKNQVKDLEKDKNNTVSLDYLIDRRTKKPVEIKNPFMVNVDSISKLQASSAEEMIDKGIDDSSSNRLFMLDGLFKTKFIGEIPRLSNRSGGRFVMTAHLGEKIDMTTGPAKYQAPGRKISNLKDGEKIKGVSDQFLFLPTLVLHAGNSRQLKNPNTGLSEFPKNPQDTMEKDLYKIPLTILRSKNGASGTVIEMLVSQNEGVLPTLTEFWNCKNNKYGIGGSVQSYHMELYPDVKLSRTTVRSKIDSDYRLRRAINITSEIIQLAKYKSYLNEDGYIIPTEEIYEKIKSMGYDWNVLLDSRGRATPKQYGKNVKPYLSSVDILYMVKEEYHPYWYPKEGIKNKFLEKGKK